MTIHPAARNLRGLGGISVTIYKALTIAGSDSGAGAGLQADLKTFAALGVYGASVVTAVTAQNTTGVDRVLETPASLVAAQIDAVMDDIGAHAVKTGMLANARIIRTVADRVERHGVERLVVDPVMAAKGGRALLRPEAVETLRTCLLPLAAVVTPNLPEAQALTGVEGTGPRAVREMARRMVDMGARSAVVKGGHRRGPATDVLYDGSAFHEFPAPRIRIPHTHGTGCILRPSPAAWPGTSPWRQRSPKPRSSLPGPSARPSPSAPGTARCTTSTATGPGTAAVDRRTVPVGRHW